MTNVYGRQRTSLNGEWQAIIDPTGVGDWRQVWTERKPQKKTDFVEYAFDGGPTLQVPGDFNTQRPELLYVEGTVWYKKTFTHKPAAGKRYFLYFVAVNYKADVYLTVKLLGSHEGGFTPFQFEITNEVREGDNALIVKANNQRHKDGLPALGYDWFNYGGITREVHLVETPATFIEDYSIQLKKHTSTEILGWVKVNGPGRAQSVRIRIPELKVNYQTRSNAEGLAEVKFPAKPQLWSPDRPKLYEVILQSATDTVSEYIGFRNIEVKGSSILLNGKPIFLKGVNIHEERPLGGGKAWSEADAVTLLSWAKELGCNLVRLAHYPHNEHMVRLAEKMGLMVWDELPVYQHIEFAATGMEAKLNRMLQEMVRRDRNRCGVVIWSLSNETYTSTPRRTESLVALTQQCRALDSTRLITSVINNQGYSNHTFNVWDTLYRHCDVIALNEYLGWYVPWQGAPAATQWKLPEQKPLIISEFGGEAKYGSDFGPGDEAAWWSEEYQDQIYKDQLAMFRTTPNLAGVCPWLLVDYRSPGRMHPIFQNGYNRKGLLSEHGEKKKAWYTLKQYYDSLGGPKQAPAY